MEQSGDRRLAPLPPRPERAVGVDQFVDDDAGYEALLQRNPAGFVVNAWRFPDSSYLKLRHDQRASEHRRVVDHADEHGLRDDDSRARRLGLRRRRRGTEAPRDMPAVSEDATGTPYGHPRPESTQIVAFELPFTDSDSEGPCQ